MSIDIQLIVNIQLIQSIMNSNSKKLNPFINCPFGQGNQSFSNQCSSKPNKFDCEQFEATFNKMHRKDFPSEIDSFYEIKAENPFTKESPFLSYNQSGKTQEKFARDHNQKVKKEDKKRTNFHYFPEKQMNAQTAIQKQLIGSEYRQSDPTDNSQYSSIKAKESFQSYKIQPNISQFQDSLSNLKIIPENVAIQKHQPPTQQNPYNQKLQEKDREIRLLRLQLERYKRCEHLNKENEVIYKRLTQCFKNQFQELKTKTEQNHFQEQIETKNQPIPEITRFLEPKQFNSKTKMIKTEYIDDEIKTPFHLGKGIQSSYIPEPKIYDNNVHKRQKSDLFHLKKDSKQSNTLTFNAKQLKPFLKDKFHAKIASNSTYRPKIYSNHYKEPEQHYDKKSAAQKLTEINQKLWQKQIEKGLSRVENRKNRSNSFMDLSLGIDYHLSQSTKHMLM